MHTIILRMIRNDLLDGSCVYDVRMVKDDEIVDFSCETERAAMDLLTSLEKTFRDAGMTVNIGDDIRQESGWTVPAP